MYRPWLLRTTWLSVLFFISLTILLHFFCWPGHLGIYFLFASFYFSNDQRRCWLLKVNHFGRNKMFQPHWTIVVLPLVRLLLQDVCSSLTGTRTLPVFQKDAFALLCKYFWALTGKNSVGKYVAKFHLSPSWNQKWGWKMSARYSFVLFFSPSQNDVWFHLKESELKSTFALCKSPRRLWIWEHIMLSWCLERCDTDQGAEYGPGLKKKRKNFTSE